MHGLSSAQRDLRLSALLYVTGNLAPLPAFPHLYISTFGLPTRPFAHATTTAPSIHSPDGALGSGGTRSRSLAVPPCTYPQGMWAPREYPSTGLATSSEPAAVSRTLGYHQRMEDGLQFVWGSPPSSSRCSGSRSTAPRLYKQVLPLSSSPFVNSPTCRDSMDTLDSNKGT